MAEIYHMLFNGRKSHVIEWRKFIPMLSNGEKVRGKVPTEKFIGPLMGHYSCFLESISFVTIAWICLNCRKSQTILNKEKDQGPQLLGACCPSANWHCSQIRSAELERSNLKVSFLIKHSHSESL